MDDDLHLLARWRAGAQGEGKQLCERHFADIYGFFEDKIPGAADELTDQTFRSCVEEPDPPRATSSFRTYLFAIARDVLYKRLRRTPKYERVDLQISSLDEIVSSLRAQPGKERELARMRAALRLLPVEQQVLLELHYWHDLDPAALAEVFAVSPEEIRPRLRLARRALRARLGADNGVAGAGGDRLVISLSEPDLDS